MILIAIHRLRFDPSSTFPMIRTKSGRDIRQLPGLSSASRFSLTHLTSAIRCTSQSTFTSADSDRIDSRPDFFEKRHERQHGDRKDAQRRRQLRYRIDTDGDQTAARKNFLYTGKLFCVSIGHAT